VGDGPGTTTCVELSLYTRPTHLSSFLKSSGCQVFRLYETFYYYHVTFRPSTRCVISFGMSVPEVPYARSSSQPTPSLFPSAHSGPASSAASSLSLPSPRAVCVVVFSPWLARLNPHTQRARCATASRQLTLTAAIDPRSSRTQSRGSLVAAIEPAICGHVFRSFATSRHFNRALLTHRPLCGMYRKTRTIVCCCWGSVGWECAADW